MENIRQRRQQLGVSLDEIAAALGSGFSRARVSAAERGLLRLEDWEIKMIRAAVERIGEVRGRIREVLQLSAQIDLAALCQDIREGRLHHAGGESSPEESTREWRPRPGVWV